MKFSNILYWCEFPNEIDWEKVSVNLDKNKVKTYLASGSMGEFKRLKTYLSRYPNIIVEGAWPTLSKEKGYWFSSFTDKQDIDKLLEYKGTKIKVDIEPPIPENTNVISVIRWISKYILAKPKNRDYLLSTLNKLGKENIIISSFPFPNWILKKYGWSNNFKHYNYMHYSSFIPRILKPIYKVYYKRFIKKHGTKNTYYAVGLLDVGIFRNEPLYKNKGQLKQDLDFLHSQGVKNIVIFRMGSLQNKVDWLQQSL